MIIYQRGQHEDMSIGEFGTGFLAFLFGGAIFLLSLALMGAGFLAMLLGGMFLTDANWSDWADLEVPLTLFGAGLGVFCVGMLLNALTFHMKC